MNINVKTYATLRKYGPQNIPLGQSFPLEIEGETITDVIETLGIPPKEDIVVLVNGNRTTDLNQKIYSDDLIVIFPRLGGG